MVGWLGATLLVLALNWTTQSVTPRPLQYEGVGPLWHLPALETRRLYALLLGGTLLFPLLASFERRIRYFARWPRLFAACGLVGSFFILWDVAFTAWGVWGFNPRYYSGIELLGLPWEEWAFFFIVPYSCLFIYESLRWFRARPPFAHTARTIYLMLSLVFFAVAFAKWSHIYTFTTFWLAGSFTLAHLWFFSPLKPWHHYFLLAWLISWIPFVLVNGALTGSFTAQPVVVYNTAEFFGWRLGTIPIDDSIYSYLMLFAITTVYELLDKRPAR